MAISKYVVTATWQDAPHLTEAQKAELEKTIRPHQRQARMKGVPVLGSGAIYPTAEEDLLVQPFDIPKYWKKAYALDVGWKRTAAIWGALDEASDTLYLYSEHYVAEEKPPVHAAAIKARGSWMHGVVDPASHGRSQEDGGKLFNRYTTDLGLRLSNADNSIDAGIDLVWDRMISGRLKVFSTLSNWRYEFRLYRRDEKGKIVKKDDHLMDTTRYLCASGIHVMMATPGAFGNRANVAPSHKTDWDPQTQLVKENQMQ